MSFHKLSSLSLKIICTFALISHRAAATPVAPHSLKHTETTSSSIRIKWECDEPADYFLLYCSQLSQGKWRGDIRWAENFSPAQCNLGSAKKLSDEDIDQFTDNIGWHGTFIYAPSKSQGVLQIGKTDTTGEFFSPPLPAMANVTLLIRAKAMARQSDNSMTLNWISNGSTNKVCDFPLDTSYKNMHCPIANIAEGDQFELRSFSSGSKRRVLIDSAFLVANFSEDEAITNNIINGYRVEYSINPETLIDNLAPDSNYAINIRSIVGDSLSDLSETLFATTDALDNIQYPTFWSGPTAKDSTPTSIQLQWPPVIGATHYKISVWTNIISNVSRGSPIWSEYFSKSTASTSTQAIPSDERLNSNYTDIAGWSIVSNVYPSIDAGSIRIGNTSKPGEIILPRINLPASAAIRILARKQTSNDSSTFRLWAISNDEMKSVGEPYEILEEYSEIIWPINDNESIEKIILRSAEGKSSYRTIIKEVQILEGFSAGTIKKDHALKDYQTTSTSFLISPINTDVWRFSIEAFNEEGQSIACASDSIDLTAIAEPQDFEALSISSLPITNGLRIYREDFSCFTNIFTSASNTAEWNNGQTIKHWQAYYGDEPIQTITRNHGAQTAKGLYAFWETNLLSQSYSIGTITSDTASDQTFGVILRNDTQHRLTAAEIEFEGKQFGFRNSIAQNVFCDYLVTNEVATLLCDGGWINCSDLTHSTTSDKTSNLTSGKDPPIITPIKMTINNIKINSGDYFLLRWRREHVSSAAAMGIDNLTIQFTQEPKPFRILIR